MERFSINILKQKVYNICRLCGVDNPEKVSILGLENSIFIPDDDEPTLANKIEQCVGIKVHKNDRMPQQICTLCVDKVNDFFEYRLMCASTNTQTRTILNLPTVHPSVAVLKQEITPIVEAIKDGYEIKRGPKTRNREKHSASFGPREEEIVDVSTLADGPCEKRMKHEYDCQVCHASFHEKVVLEKHLIVKHTPLVTKFGCGSCTENFDTSSEYKDHNLWHKLTRTPYNCFWCSKKFVKLTTLNKHVVLKTCFPRSRVINEIMLVPDMRCTLCHKVFKTQNLYEWHGCFIRGKAHCPKCGKYFLKKNVLFRHYMLYCQGTLVQLDPVLIPKDELGPVTVNDVPNGTSKAAAAPAVAGRRRGRPRQCADQNLKEETMELPCPTLLDLIEVKSETTLNPEALFPVVEMAEEGMGDERKVLKSIIDEETDKIASLLRTGASVDGNSDIATLNTMLSSVNEAIATISIARKKKKKKNHLSKAVTENELINNLCAPMVVLSKANVKQEENAGAFESLTNCSSNPNELQLPNIVAMEESFADDDEAIDTTVKDVGVVKSCITTTELSTGGHAIDSHDVTVGLHNIRTTESLHSLLPAVRIKQEPLSYNDDMESGFAGVKQERIDQMDVSESAQQRNEHNDVNSSAPSYHVQRIKIKKEKGLHNASVVVKEVDSIPTRSATESNEPVQKKSYVDNMPMTSKKQIGKRNYIRAPGQNFPHSALSEIRVKQEPTNTHDSLYARIEETPVSCGMILQLKQEPRDDGPCELSRVSLNSASVHRPDVIAFDGKNIKQERSENKGMPRIQTISNNEKLYIQDLPRRAFNPMSLYVGTRTCAQEEFVPSNTPNSGNKPNVMINPFALLRQKTNLADVEAHDSISTENASLGALAGGYTLPVISQVKSIDLNEHLSVSYTASVIVEPSVPEENKTNYLRTLIGEDNSNNANILDVVEPISNASTITVLENENVCEQQCGMRM